MTLHNCRRTYKSLKVRVNNSKIEKENEASDSLIHEEESFEFVTRLKILPRDMVFGWNFHRENHTTFGNERKKETAS